MRILFSVLSFLIVIPCFSQEDKVDSLMKLGFNFLSESNYAQSLKCFNQSLEISTQEKNRYRIGKINKVLGKIYYYTGDYSKSIKHSMDALHILEPLNKKGEVVEILVVIGSIYFVQEDFRTALNYHKKSLAISDELDDRFRIGLSYHNMGIAYSWLYLPDSSLQCYFNAIRIWEEIKDTSDLIASLIGVGNIYENQDKPKEAIKYYSLGLKCAEKSKNIRNRIGLLNNIAVLYFNKNKYTEALDYLNKSLSLSKETGLKASIAECYDLISQTYSGLQNYHKAYIHHQLYVQLKDSIFNEQSNKQITEMQTKYESEKKEQQIKILNKDKQIQYADLKRQKLISYSVIGGLVIVLLFSLLLINRFLFIRKQKKVIEIEREKSEKLLLNILPKDTADELKKTGKAQPRHYEMATVMFTDFKGFTTLAEKMSAEELVGELDFIFKKYDEIISRYPIEKIKTIGDSYMCVGGVPLVNETNPIDVVMAALEIKEFMDTYSNRRRESEKACTERKRSVRQGESEMEHSPTFSLSHFPHFEVRIGIHTGPVIAGVVGDKKFAYDIWGDTVNTASRMESSGEAGKVNISGETYRKLNTFSDDSHPSTFGRGTVGEVKEELKFTFRGKIPAKNKGEVEMYFVEW